MGTHGSRHAVATSMMSSAPHSSLFVFAKPSLADATSVASPLSSSSSSQTSSTPTSIDPSGYTHLDPALDVLRARGVLRLITQFQDGLDGKLHALVAAYTAMPSHNEAFIVRAMLSRGSSSKYSRPRRSRHNLMHSQQDHHPSRGAAPPPPTTSHPYDDQQHHPLETVKTLYRFRRREVFTPACLVYLAKHGSLRVLAYLHAVGCTAFTPQVMDAAAQYGHLSLVQFLHTHRLGCTTAAMNGAARSGHLDIVKFLHAHRSEGCTSAAMDGAANNGYVDVVKFLHAHCKDTCDMDSALKLATDKGHLEIVRFLHDLDDANNVLNVLVWAARKGHLDIVKYMQETHKEAIVRFNHHVIYTATERGHTDIVEYLTDGARGGLIHTAA
ncbi:hypothetical protein DYB26_008311 [Aphanomyces astaci]|uniref:Uncharacterized protein n=1 Tax=Aphanomyces astaci TaxID=112090 RepID=A0A3R6VSQ7_APHAT|nr:hypothetical protein DYB34_006882 [Aphanomyces astaci]RHZ10239.1 hypothetical protein DYB26_008311 [Aphanomyces astaci]